MNSNKKLAAEGKTIEVRTSIGCLIESLKSQNRDLETQLAVKTTKDQKENCNLNAEIAMLYEELGIPYKFIDENSPYENLTNLNRVIKLSK